jgi:DNA polymerase-3 subunit epsilon
MLRQIILDTETTGLYPEKGHRIIEIACLEMINRQMTKSYYHCYLNPERAVEVGAFNVHGITEEFLADKAKFTEIMHDFLAYIKDAELIIHNAKFDVGFINHELKLAKADIQSIETWCTVTDTLAMARRKHPGQRNSLDALCKRYNVDNSKRTLHGALIDCELLADVYLYMTGGQKKLFEESSTNHQQRKLKKSRSKITEKHNLVVVDATPAEQAEHEAFLDHLKETTGHALWCLEDEEDRQ